MGANETAAFIERVACISCGGRDLQELTGGGFDEGAVGRFMAEDPWGEHPAPFLRGQRWSYVACRECGLAFHRYILAPEWNERRFSRWMSQDAIAAFEKQWKTHAWHFRQATEHTAHVLRIEKLTRELRGSQPVRLLDFGCGYGEFLSMCELYGFDACGVDRSSARRDNNSHSKVFAEIEHVEALAPFHALTLFEVLEHLDEPHALMLRLRDLLATGGVLVLQTPDCSGVRKIETREEYHKIHPLEHINGFTPATLKDFAARLGFEPLASPIACVTSDVNRMAKSLLHPLVTATTRQYFRKR